jgi:arylsulfatase A-like enzyme
MNRITRRDFLKASSVLTAGALTKSLLGPLEQDNQGPNVIVFLCDTLSAKHMSLYGYSRETTPQLSRFAERATVYHNHYSGGNFTTPGTASLLTGMIPWTHRAFNQGGLIKGDLVQNNIYSLLGGGFYRFFFSQNPWAARLVSQAYKDIEEMLPITAYSLSGNKLLSDKVGNDRYLASIAFDEFLFSLNAAVMGSPLLGYLYKNYVVDIFLKTQEHPWYPRGVPQAEGYENYINEDIYRGVYRELSDLDLKSDPYFAYIHLYSPHHPYKPGRKYFRLFEEDGYSPPAKPEHPFGRHLSEGDIQEKRLLYDQQIAHVDAEFGLLMDKLEADGALDNSYLIFTSDHGELFERGFYGHGGLLMYEGNLNIPLLISTPGQSTRQDVYTPTGNIDVLPTLLSILDKEIPDVLDGQILPGFGGVEEEQRALFSMFAAENSVHKPLQKTVLSMHKDIYKLIGYYGYPGYDHVYELYNLEDDPEELHDLSTEDVATFARLKEEMLDSLADANRPYE